MREHITLFTECQSVTTMLFECVWKIGSNGDVFLYKQVLAGSCQETNDAVVWRGRISYPGPGEV